MITVEDWAEIRRLRKVEKLSERAIARRLGIHRDTHPGNHSGRRLSESGLGPAGLSAAGTTRIQTAGGVSAHEL